ncbi:MAG: orotidine-5-phosphate decarboxylase [Archaeoglobi archaeon]|nr:orotidine-5'-phosphate decarboxylase [Candidatus Mnemosynella bozhongmuii]MDI3501944.1 orotidine-5-phosphate decarboxylase [Archaeoglobi archaeon]MDK2781225.1 orotidine-5-phosphate decarboxylase [Archaeoglobi archaeon]
MKFENGIIVALDSQRVEIVEELAGKIDALKVGYPLILPRGLRIVEELSESIPVIVDIKIADVPHVNSMICEMIFRSGASAVISHGFTGKDSIRACVEKASEFDASVFIVAEMSHPGSLDFLSHHSVEIARIAELCGAEGIVAPATRTESIRKFRDLFPELKIISPGVGAQGGSAYETILSGADAVIIGRTIYESEDIGGTLESVKEEIRRAREEKRRLKK